MRASYTLQFADGTGSDPNAAARLMLQTTKLRTIYPYNYDQRHQIIVASDYRYGSGKITMVLELRVKRSLKIRVQT